jgi:hypothetical protein
MAHWEKMSDDRLAAMKAQSETQLRSVSGRLHRKIGSAEASIEWHQRQVALSSANLANWQNDSTVPEEHIILERRRLAESLIVVGELDKAIEIAPTEELKSRAVALKAAIDSDDSDHCDCKAIVHRGHNFSSRHGILFHIKSKKHGKIMPVRKCAECGDLNVSEDKVHPQLTPEDERRLGHATDADRQKYAAMHQAGLRARMVK